MSNFETGAERTAQGANADIFFTGISKPLAKKNKAKSKVTISNIQPKLISLFSGGGGLDLGLEAAGFETIFATDIDAYSCITLETGKAKAKHLGLPFLQKSTIRQANILDLSSSDIMAVAGIHPGEVDLLAGGPPCQAFSVFGKRLGVNDPRGLLPYEYLRILAEIQPKAFVFENVLGLLTIHEGKTFKELCERLKNPSKGVNYTLSVFRLNAADYGVPQSRNRIFIVGSADGKKLGDIPPICGGLTTATRGRLPNGATLRTYP